MSKRISKLSFFILYLFLLLFVQGCWGARETDQLAYILAIGIDKGKENMVQITFQIAIPQAPGGEGGGGGETEKMREIVSLETSSLFGALQLANAFVSRELTLIHNRIVVVSEDIAKEGLGKYINPLMRSREIRRTNFLLVSKGKARDFLENNRPILEKNPSRQLELMLKGKKFTGIMPFATIHEYYTALKSPGQQAVAALVGVNEGKEDKEGKGREKSSLEKIKSEMAHLPGEIPRHGGNKIEVIGLAVFEGDKLVGYLNGAETRYYQMVAGKFDSAIITFPDPEEQEDFVVVIKIKKGRSPELRVTFPEGKPLLQANLILEGEILSIQSGINYEKGIKEAELQRFIEEFISKEVIKIIQKTQKEFKSDIFGFGEHTRKYFWTWKEWEEFAWLEKYPEAEVKVNTRLEIRRPGLLGKTAITHTTGGEKEGE